MSSHATLFLVGIFLAALPFLGFPHSWDSVLITLAGVACMAISFVVRSERARNAPLSREAYAREETFIETRPKRARRARPRVLPDIKESRESEKEPEIAIARHWPSVTPPSESEGASVLVPRSDNRSDDFQRENERVTANAT